VSSRRSLLTGRPRFGRDDAEFDRAIGFLDATYALALTLLVTTLEVEDVPAAWAGIDSLYDAVGAQFVTFLIAFAVIASYWLNHHRLVSAFTAIDYPAIVLNLVLVASIVLLPFTTRYVGDPSVDEEALPTVALAVNVALCSVLHSCVYALAVARGLLDGRPSALEYRGYLTLSLLPAAVFLLSIPIAYASPPGARAFWLVLVPVMAVARHRIVRSVTREQATG
jgi:uncharacterized membrane protein